MDEKDFEKMSVISRSIKKIMRDHSAAEELLLSRAWKESVGDIIFSKTSIGAVGKEVLTVDVQDERWRKVLKGMKRELLRRLNESLGEERFKEVDFKVRAVS